MIITLYQLLSPLLTHDNALYIGDNYDNYLTTHSLNLKTLNSSYVENLYPYHRRQDIIYIDGAQFATFISPRKLNYAAIEYDDGEKEYYFITDIDTMETSENADNSKPVYVFHLEYDLWGSNHSAISNVNVVVDKCNSNVICQHSANSATPIAFRFNGAIMPNKVISTNLLYPPDSTWVILLSFNIPVLAQIATGLPPQNICYVNFSGNVQQCIEKIAQLKIGLGGKKATLRGRGQVAFTQLYDISLQTAYLMPKTLADGFITGTNNQQGGVKFSGAGTEYLLITYNITVSGTKSTLEIFSPTNNRIITAYCVGSKKIPAIGECSLINRNLDKPLRAYSDAQIIISSTSSTLYVRLLTSFSEDDITDQIKVEFPDNSIDGLTKTQTEKTQNAILGLSSIIQNLSGGDFLTPAGAIRTGANLLTNIFSRISAANTPIVNNYINRGQGFQGQTVKNLSMLSQYGLLYIQELNNNNLYPQLQTELKNIGLTCALYENIKSSEWQNDAATTNLNDLYIYLTGNLVSISSSFTKANLELRQVKDYLSQILPQGVYLYV